MYYLRIIDEQNFGFVISDIHDVLETDIPINSEEYNDFFDNHNGKNFRVKNPNGTKLFDIIEEYTKEIIVEKTPIELIQEHNVEIVATTWDIDYRLLELEWALEDVGLFGINSLNTFNLNKNRGGKTMALSRHEQAKIMILGGVYNKATLTKQLTRYLEKGLVSKEEYYELIALMEAKELVTGE